MQGAVRRKNRGKQTVFPCVRSKREPVTAQGVSTARAIMEVEMGKGLLLWLIGIPIPIIILVWLLGGLH
jgi:hypothetical protein